MLSDWFLFWLLTIDVLEPKMVAIGSQPEKREHCVEKLNESPAESLTKLILFRGE